MTTAILAIDLGKFNSVSAAGCTYEWRRDMGNT